MLLMNYDRKSLAVVNLFIVPKHFFVRDIIEERKPLAATARRGGWIGSNILLEKAGDWQESYCSERHHSSEGSRPRGMAEDPLSEK